MLGKKEAKIRAGKVLGTWEKRGKGEKGVFYGGKGQKGEQGT